MRTNRLLVCGLSLGVLAACGTTPVKEDGGTDGGTDAGLPPSPLAVVSTEPGDGSTNVSLDQIVRVVFNHALPDDLELGGVTVRDAAGALTGQVLVDGAVVKFVPARFAAQTTYTVRFPAGFGPATNPLAAEHRFSFTTGTVNQDGSRPPPDDYSPLGPAEEIALSRQVEAAIVWTRAEYHTSNWDHADYAADEHFALEDPPFNPAPMTNPGGLESFNRAWRVESALSDYENEPFTGQFDGDAFGEVAVVSRTAAGVLSLAVEDTSDAGTSLVATALQFAEADAFSAVAADFDGDTREELLLAVGKASQNPRWYLVKWTPGGYELAKQGTLPITTYQVVKVAAGDLDGDGRAEAIFGWVTGVAPNSVKYSVYRDLPGTPTPLVDSQTVVSDLSWSNDTYRGFFDVLAGDLDGDGADELAFGITNLNWVNSSGVWRTIDVRQRLFVADSYKGSTPATLQQIGDEYQVKPAGGRGWIFGDGWGKWGVETVHRPMSVFVAGRLAGDPLREELLFFNRVFQFKKSVDIAADSIELETGWPRAVPTSIIDLDGVPGGLGIEGRDPVDLCDGFYTRDVRVGNVDGDLKDEVVLLRKSSPQSDRDGRFKKGFFMTAFNLDLTKSGEQAFARRDIDFVQTYEDSFAALTAKPRLALVDVDDDSYVVKLTAHEVVTDENKLVAVLAAAPWKTGINQDVDSCGAEFGQGASTSWTKGTSMSWGASVTFGTSFNLDAGGGIGVNVSTQVLAIELMFTAGYEGGYDWQWSLSRSEEFSYGAGPNNNLVIFDSNVFDRYRYTIVRHPNRALVGEEVAIHVPTGRKRLAVSQGYYNRINGTGPDIDAAVLAVVPGDLTSYPTRQQAEAVMASPTTKLKIVPPSATLSPPEGLGNTTSYVFTRSDAFAHGSTHGFTTEISASICVYAVCGGLGANWGMSWSYSYETSEDISFGVTLGGIASEDYAAHSYRAGLFAYTHRLPGNANQEFYVVNFFVER